MDPVVADDFLCTDGKEITEVHFWGSYIDDPYEPGEHWQQGNPGPPVNPLPPTPGLKAFKLSFHKDIPAGVDPDMPWSHPGELIRQFWVDFEASETGDFEVFLPVSKFGAGTYRAFIYVREAGHEEYIVAAHAGMHVQNH